MPSLKPHFVFLWSPLPVAPPAVGQSLIWDGLCPHFHSNSLCSLLLSGLLLISNRPALLEHRQELNSLPPKFFPPFPFSSSPPHSSLFYLTPHSNVLFIWQKNPLFIRWNKGHPINGQFPLNVKYISSFKDRTSISWDTEILRKKKSYLIWNFHLTRYLVLLLAKSYLLNLTIWG